MEQPFPFVLASNSPRRKQLLALGGWQFDIQPASIDENPIPGEGPRPYVLRMAESKARAGAARLGVKDSAIVLGSDTIVVDTPDPQAGNHRQPQILGKPASAREAAAMLQQLRGRIHQVITAVALYRPADDRMISNLCITDVKMRAFSTDEIWAYIATGDPLDKAGAYAIQHAGFDPVESIQGCFANVVGLPLCILHRSLAQFEFKPPFEIPNPGDHETCLFCKQVKQLDI